MTVVEKQLIETFLSGKKLSLNSQKSYRYDLQQFLDVIDNDVTDTRLQLYQAFLKQLSVTAEKRKLSAVNQFLFFLYQEKEVATYHRLQTEVRRQAPSVSSEQIDLSVFYDRSDFKEGQLVALLILELGLTPSEMAQLETRQVDTVFRVLTCQTAKNTRVLQLPDRLLPFLENQGGEHYFFQNGQKPYSRQWYFRRLSEFLESVGHPQLTAQKLREQFILRKKEEGLTIFEVAKELGLKTSLSLEKYFKN